jgi:hypothetical protein
MSCGPARDVGGALVVQMMDRSFLFLFLSAVRCTLYLEKNSHQKPILQKQENSKREKYQPVHLREKGKEAR